jgi:hypothetical protein
LDGTSEDENFLKRIITSDDTWVYGYENAVFTTGWKKFAKTEKCAATRVKCESHVDGCFDIEGVCIMNSYARGKQ